MKTAIGLHLLVLLVWTVGAQAKMDVVMDIVRDGQPVATVVVLKEAPEVRSRGFAANDATAADVLVDWVKKITGAELPITESASSDTGVIYIGGAAVEAGLRLDDIESASNEGARIVAEDGNVLIGGQSGIATVRAVCRFLEELGCRYFMEGPLGEVYPKKQTLTLGRLNITEKPGFMSRRIWGSNWTGTTLWKIWNGAGGVTLQTGHSWGKYVPESLFELHPEYFRLRDGQRNPSPWLCTSNPDMREIFAEKVIETIESGDTNPSTSPPDGTVYCQCPTCKAQDDPNSMEPSSGSISMTNRYVDFFHDVAVQVAKSYPESILSFYCYADYTQPPTTRQGQALQLHSNLCAWIAPIRFCRLHAISNSLCSSRLQLAEVIAGWSEVADKIGYRTYNYNLAECTVPFPMISVWKHDIPYLRDEGCIGINFETLPSWHIYGPHIYLSIRLAYSPDADANAIMDDYFMRFYGAKAGPIMREYWTRIDKAFANLECHSGGFYAVHLVYTPEFISECQELLDRAADAAAGTDLKSAGENKTYEERVAMHAEGFKNAVQYIQMRDAMNRGDFARAKVVYGDLLARNEALVEAGYANHYTPHYIQRFLGKVVESGAVATESPNQVLQVLPDTWRLAYDEADTGVQSGYYQQEFDDSKWTEVATYSRTLDAQGLPDRKTVMWYRASFNAPSDYDRLSLFFCEIDGSAAVYVNGRKVGEQSERRVPFEMDVTEAAHSGDNLVVVRVDHSRITELFLGGIIRPVLLISKRVEANSTPAGSE